MELLSNQINASCQSSGNPPSPLIKRGGIRRELEDKG